MHHVGIVTDGTVTITIDTREEKNYTLGDGSSENFTDMVVTILNACGWGLMAALGMITFIASGSSNSRWMLMGGYQKTLKAAALFFSAYPIMELHKIGNLRAAIEVYKIRWFLYGTVETKQKQIQKSKDEILFSTITKGLLMLATIPFVSHAIGEFPTRASFMKDYGVAIRIAAIFFLFYPLGKLTFVDGLLHLTRNVIESEKG